jgi:hypothetical protein
MHKVYANIGYGLSDNVEGFVRLGAGNAEWDKISGRSYDWEGDDGDWDFIWGGGFKATLSDSADVKWGLLAQYSWCDLSGSQKGDGYTGGYELKLDELQIAIGPTWRAGEGVVVYGGPFLHFVRGRWQDNIWDDNIRKAVEEESWFGGYIGTAIDLDNDSSLNIEYQLTGDAWAVAGGILWMLP